MPNFTLLRPCNFRKKGSKVFASRINNIIILELWISVVIQSCMLYLWFHLLDHYLQKTILYIHCFPLKRFASFFLFINVTIYYYICLSYVINFIVTTVITKILLSLLTLLCVCSPDLFKIPSSSLSVKLIGHALPYIFKTLACSFNWQTNRKLNLWRMLKT